jgi:hypothetical protein
MTDKPTSEGWMTQAERLRAIVSHTERHCISSDVLFAVLVALEDACFIQDDGDEYNNDEAIAAFKALKAEIKQSQPTLTDEERNAIAWAATVAEEWDRDSIEWAIQQSIRLRDGKRAATLRSLLERTK